MKALFIVNPKSGRGKPAECWPRIAEIFRNENQPFDVAFTQHRGHAATLARDARRVGAGLVVAVGGDGVVNEVVNGLCADGDTGSSTTSLGIIPCGTGNALARMLGLPRETLAAARHLALSRQTRTIDLGEISCVVAGKNERRLFANDANFGFAAQVVERCERTGKFSRGTLPYLTALLLTALRHRNHDLKLQVDGQDSAGSFATVLVCNGETTGGGMRVAPGALLDDGRLDVIVIGHLRPWEIFWHAPKIYRGTHVAIRKVSVQRAQKISVASPEKLSIVADGEIVGEAPATFRVLPQAMNVRV